jgi:hypothetical protein
MRKRIGCPAFQKREDFLWMLQISGMPIYLLEEASEAEMSELRWDAGGVESGYASMHRMQDES